MDKGVKTILERVGYTADFGYVTFDSVNATNALGDNALHCVCTWGDLDVARTLIVGGINVNQVGEFGDTPLRRAERFEEKELAELLRANGAELGTGIYDDEAEQSRHDRHMRMLAESIERLERLVEEECGDDVEQGVAPDEGSAIDNVDTFG